MKSLWMDEGGAVLSVELILLLVILVIGLITGLVALRDAVVSQLGELALSVASIDTSFSFDGLSYTESLTDGLITTALTGNAKRVEAYATDLAGGETLEGNLAINGVAATEVKAD